MVDEQHRWHWGRVTVLPDGRRLFPEWNEGNVAIADDSGREPQDCDDGVLWLDMEVNLMIIRDADYMLCIPVKRASDGKRVGIQTNVSTMIHLSAEFEWPIEDQFIPGNEVYRVIKERRS